MTLPSLPSAVLDPQARDWVVACDTEGSGLEVDDGARVSLVSVAWDSDAGPVVYSFPFNQGEVTLLDPDVNLPRAEWDFLIDWLGFQRLIFQNAKHDLHQLRAGTIGGWPGKDLAGQLQWDTLLAEWIIAPLLPHGLDPMGHRYVGEGKDTSELEAWLKKTKNRYDLVPWSVMEGYADQDVSLTLRIAHMQMAKLDELGWKLVQRELEVCQMLVGVERRGIGYDVENGRAALAAAQLLERQARDNLPFEATPAKARTYFYTQLGAKPHCTTEGGATSIQACCVRSLVKQKIPSAEEFAYFQKVSHAISTWYDGYLSRVAPDGRLRTNFKQMGTVSMRFASGRVNLQALPHDYQLELIKDIPTPRALFVAKDGYELWEMDMGQAELRVATVYARCVKMRELLESGADAHGETAKQLFGEITKEYRQVAKRANFSLIFGVGADTFRDSVEKYTGIIIPRGEAIELVKKWRALYPEYGAAIRRAENKIKAQGHVRLISGRQRWFKSHEDPHKGFNQAVQGSVAEAMKDWMVEIDRLWPETLVLTVHDSAVLEVLIGSPIVKEAALLGEKMHTALFGIPMTIDVKPWG